MRPKKIVLLFSVDDDRRSPLALLLRTRGYFVIGGISPEAPIPAVVLIADDRTLTTVAMATYIAEKLPDVPILALPAPKYRTLSHGFPQCAEMIPPHLGTIELLERVRVLARRKTGPKKQVKAATVAVETALAN